MDKIFLIEKIFPCINTMVDKARHRVTAVSRAIGAHSGPWFRFLAHQSTGEQTIPIREEIRK